MGKAKIMDLKELDFYNRITHPMACESYDEFKGEEKKMLDEFLDRGILIVCKYGVISEEQMDRDAIPDPTHSYIENYIEYKLICNIDTEWGSCPKTFTYLYEQINYRIRYGEERISRHDLQKALDILVAKKLVEQYWSIDPITLQEEPTYRTINQFKRGESR